MEANTDALPHEIELGKVHGSKASLEEDNKSQLVEADEVDEANDELDNVEIFQPVALCFLQKDARPRRWFISLFTWPYFERISICVILINCVTLGLFDPSDSNCETDKCHVLEKVETSIYAFFLAEMLVKWIALGLFGKLGYFADSWNRLDFFIVAAGTLELALGTGEELSSIRAIRVLRPLRAINRVPSIRILVTLLLDTLPMLGNVLAVCSLIFAIFGIVGVQMWGGLLRGRCYLEMPSNLTASSYNLSPFYEPSFETDFVCSLPTGNGMKRCTSDMFHFYTQAGNRSQCNETYASFQEKSRRSNYTNVCVNWNQYYDTCRLDGPNPYFGALSFDNIFIAWVAIFQVITLEGWSDIMYFIQDANGVWNWVYFIVLIVVGSYFMTNLCLVVITTQFQETKQRESELMKANLRRQAASTSTLNSSRFGKEGCWIEILKYIEHLLRRLKRRLLRRFKCNYVDKSKATPRTSRRKKSRTKKHVYHHHHHHHHHHHFHHHVSCPIANNLAIAPNASREDAEPRRNPNRDIYSTGNTLMVPGQVPQATPVHPINTPMRRASHDGVPAINIVTGSSCSVRPETHVPSTSGEMLTTTKAEVSINGQSATADVNTRSVLSAASSTIAASTASAAAATTIQNACACAVQHLEKDMKVDYDTEFVYEEDDASGSEYTDDEDERSNERRTSLGWRVRRACRSAVDSKWFMYVIMGAIFLNTLSMGVEFHEQPQKMTDALEILNYIFTAVFAIEMILKLIGFGPYGYIKDILNIFDALIVIMSIVELFGNADSGISVLRSFRLLRIFKLVRFMPALQRQLLVMVRTMDNVVTFLALLALFIFTASILGMHLFGGKYSFPDEDGELQTARANFDDLFWALVTVFQILTQEDWNTVMYDGMRATSKWAALYFILLMTIGNYILFNLLVAILVEGFASQPEKAESTVNIQKEKASYNGPDSYQRMRNSRVCITPTPSVIYVDQLDQRALCNCRRRSSLPDFYAKSSYSPAITHQSAPTTPLSLTPIVSRKTQTPAEEPVLVVTSSQTNAETAWNEKDESDVERGKDESVPVEEGNSLFARRRTWSLYVFSPNNLCRQVAQKWVANKWFDRIVLFFIIMNCIVMALDGPQVKDPSTKRSAIDICMYIFLAVFTLEMAIKVIAMGFYVGDTAYLRSAWNVMDCFLVVVSWVDVIVDLSTDTESSILGILRVFRALRTLRPLRVISRAPGLKLVVETLISSLKPIGNIVLIAATFFAIFGILGVQLFKGKFYYCSDSSVENKTECKEKGEEWLNKEYNFDNLAKALLTLFVFSTKDGWVTIMYDGIDTVGIDMQPKRNNAQWNVIYFVAFLLLAGFVVLNMLVGVVVENFQKCRDLASKDLMREREQKRAKRLKEKRENEAAEEFPQPRRFVYHVCTHGYFDLAIAVIIALNVVCMAMEHYQQPAALGEFLRVANYFFTAVFILEAILKIYAMRKPYFKDRWNLLDVIIVLLSIVGIVLEEMNADLPINPTIIRVMRVLRIARVLKLLKTAEGIRKLLDTVAQALPAVGNLGLLFLLMFFIFAALGVELFGNIDCDKLECEGLDEHAHFRDFGFAMLTLFRVSTGDNWNGILKDTINTKRCEVDPHQGCTALEHIAPIYFAVFVLATQFVLLNVVVAVLMKHLEEAREIDLEEQASQSAAADTSTLDESNKDIRPNKTSLKVPNEKQRKVSFGDEQSICSEEDRMPDSEANNNAGHPPKTGSESSLSSREIDKLIRPRRDSEMLRRLPPIDKSDNISLRSTGSVNLGYHMMRSRPKPSPKQVESVSVPELSAPRPQEIERRERQMSPRAPIYHLSEDSDWYDSVLNIGNYPAKRSRSSTEGMITSDGGRNIESGQNIPSASHNQRDTKPENDDSSESTPWAYPVSSPDEDQQNSPCDVTTGGDVEMAVLKPQSANPDSKDLGHKNQSYV